MFYEARRLINAVHVDFRHELQQRRLIRVHFPAVDLQRVNPILERGLGRMIEKGCQSGIGQLIPISTHPGRTDDHSCPVRERHVVVVLQTPGDSAIADTLLTLFQFLQETEIAGHH